MEDHLWDILLGVDFQILERDGYQRQVRGEDTVILAHLHCLPSTIRFFQILTREDLSIPSKQIILIPKPYSTMSAVEATLSRMGLSVLSGSIPFKPGYYDGAASVMLKKGCEEANKACRNIRNKGGMPRLVLVDDGGMLTETWWRHFETGDFEIASVQQTSSGTRRDPRPNELAKVDVARSAAKRQFEAKIIAAGVLKKAAELDVLKTSKQVGIVGVGALGSALAADLARSGRCVNLYDVRPDYRRPAKSASYSRIGVFLNNCDLVFGCTGRNFLKADHLRKIKASHSIHFVSCSSRDTEFLDLLRFGKIDPESVGDGFGRLQISFEGRQCHIVENGGFPVNFDRTVEQECAEEIVLTRALVLAGIFQALCVKVKERRENLLMLSPSIQQSLVLRWLRMTGRSPLHFDSTADIEVLSWWKIHSSGELPKPPPSLHVVAKGPVAAAAEYPTDLLYSAAERPIDATAERPPPLRPYSVRYRFLRLLWLFRSKRPRTGS